MICTHFLHWIHIYIYISGVGNLLEINISDSSKKKPKGSIERNSGVGSFFLRYILGARKRDRLIDFMRVENFEKLDKNLFGNLNLKEYEIWFKYLNRKIMQPKLFSERNWFLGLKWFKTLTDKAFKFWILNWIELNCICTKQLLGWTVFNSETLKLWIQKCLAGKELKLEKCQYISILFLVCLQQYSLALALPILFLNFLDKNWVNRNFFATGEVYPCNWLKFLRLLSWRRVVASRLFPQNINFESFRAVVFQSRPGGSAHGFSGARIWFPSGWGGEGGFPTLCLVWPYTPTGHLQQVAHSPFPPEGEPCDVILT